MLRKRMYQLRVIYLFIYLDKILTDWSSRPNTFSWVDLLKISWQIFAVSSQDLAFFQAADYRRSPVSICLDVSSCMWCVWNCSVVFRYLHSRLLKQPISEAINNKLVIWNQYKPMLFNKNAGSLSGKEYKAISLFKSPLKLTTKACDLTKMAVLFFLGAVD